jgi:hypothetical protein
VPAEVGGVPVPVHLAYPPVRLAVVAEEDDDVLSY